MLEINKLYNYLAINGMSKLDDKTIDCIITSPPYWQLRDYGFSEQWGLEPTYQEYLEHLWSFMDEAWRVVKDQGTVWINLGDTYGTLSGGVRGLVRNNKQYGQISYKAVLGQGFNQVKPKNMEKCLLLIPHRFAIGCTSPDYILRDDLTEEEKQYVISELIKYEK